MKRTNIESCLEAVLNNLELNYTSETLLDEGLKDRWNAFKTGVSNAINPQSTEEDLTGADGNVESFKNIISNGCLLWDAANQSFIGIPEVDMDDKEVVLDIQHNYPNLRPADANQKAQALQDPSKVKIIPAHEVTGNVANVLGDVIKGATEDVAKIQAVLKGRTVLFPSEAARLLGPVAAEFQKLVQKISPSSAASSSNTSATAAQLPVPPAIVSPAPIKTPGGVAGVGNAAKSGIPTSKRPASTSVSRPANGKNPYVGSTPEAQAALDKYNPKNCAPGQISYSIRTQEYKHFAKRGIYIFKASPDGETCTSGWFIGTEATGLKNSLVKLDNAYVAEQFPKIKQQVDAAQGTPNGSGKVVAESKKVNE